jgi:sugar phosphate isomerase/epimerase
LPRFLAIRRQAVSGETGLSSEVEVKPEDVATSMRALSELIRLAKDNGARVVVAQHWMYPEVVSGTRSHAQDMIERTAREAGAEVVQIGPAFRAAIDAGATPYRDYIHPSTAGQHIIGHVLTRAILNRPSDAPHPDNPPR